MLIFLFATFAEEICNKVENWEFAWPELSFPEVSEFDVSDMINKMQEVVVKIWERVENLMSKLQQVSDSFRQPPEHRAYDDAISDYER